MMKLMLTKRAPLVTTAFVKLSCMATGNQLYSSLVLLLTVFVIIFRSTALAILKSKKWEQAMKFRQKDTNETPLRMLIQHMPGRFSGSIYTCIKAFDDRFGRICTIPVH